MNKQTRLYRPGDKVRLLDSAFDQFPSLTRAECVAAVGVLTVVAAHKVEITDHPLFQSLDLVGLPYAVCSTDVEEVR